MLPKSLSFIQPCTSFTGDYSQLKSKWYKDESYPDLSFSRKGKPDFSAGLSNGMSTSNTSSDPWLSFLYGASAVDECENVLPDSSSEISVEEVHSNDKVLERYDEVSLYQLFVISHFSSTVKHQLQNHKFIFDPSL